MASSNTVMWARGWPVVVLSFALLLLSACGSVDVAANPIIPRIPVARVDVTPVAVGPLAPGGAAVLTATVRAADGSVLVDRVVTWASPAPMIATVSTDGTVTAVGSGTTTVTATSEGVSGSATVTVRLTVARVVVTPGSLSLVRGANQTITARLESASGTVLTDRPVTWTSTNPAVATVTTAGVVTAMSVGEATIAATSEGITANITVTVRSPVATVGVVPNPVQLSVGETAVVRAVARDADGTVVTGIPVIWSSNTPTVASISPSGVVTAVSRGTAVLAAQVEGLTATATVTTLGVASITIGGAPGNIAEVDRDTPLLAAVGVDPGAAVSTAVTWRTDSPGLATVSATGVLQAHAPGPVVVTAISVADTSKRASLTLALRWPTTPAPASIEVGGDDWTWDHAIGCGLRLGRASCWGNAQWIGASFPRTDGNSRPVMVESPRLVGTSVRFASLSVGDQHACGVSVDRSILCWGENSWGALGQTTVGALNPVPLSGAGTWAQVSAGFRSTCALSVDSRAWCWGWNTYGNAGIGSTEDRVTTPTLVAGGLSWRFLSAGWGTTCGITSEARLYCWGQAPDGAPGPLPIEFGVGRTWASVSTIESRYCAITTQGELFCGSRGRPVAAISGERFTRVSVGVRHACATTVDQTLLCWGSGIGGNLGRWTNESASPSPGPGGVWRSVITGATWETCGVRMDWSVACWGLNRGGRLGLGTTTSGISVNAVAQPVREVRGGGNHHRCVIFQDGTGTCSGWNNDGQLGSIADIERRPGNTVNLGAIASGRFLSTTTTYDATVALTSDGVLWGWGGGLGPAPVGSHASRRWRSLADGGTNFGEPGHRCFLTEANIAWCEGANRSGQLGRGQIGGNYESLAEVDGGRTWRSLAVGGLHTCGIDTDGRGWCWGDNGVGQLGDGTKVSRSTPTLIEGGFRWRLLSAAGYGETGVTTCGIRDNGRAYCWGRGPLGNGGDGGSTLPVEVAGPTQEWLDLSVGVTHRCGTTIDRRVWCWGRNLYGESAPESTALNSFVPTLVTGVTADRVSAMGRGYNTRVWAATCAWSSTTPYLACWGDNHLGMVDQSPAAYRGAFNTPQTVVIP